MSRPYAFFGDRELGKQTLALGRVASLCRVGNLNGEFGKETSIAAV